MELSSFCHPLETNRLINLKPMKKINAFGRRWKVLLFFATVPGLFVASCKKSVPTGLEDAPRQVLSKNSPDFSARLAAIREKFYASGLDQKLVPNVDQKISWTPDWSHPKTQIVNDSVSYVFYRLIAHFKKDGKSLEAKEIGAASYLMVKNEREFFRAFYYRPENNANKAQNAETFSMDSFTGNLLLRSLDHEKSFLLDYVNGKVSQAYLKKKLLAVNREAFNRPATTSYWERQCQRVLKHCQWASDGPSNCWGGMVHIIYSENCNWPSSSGCGGANYTLVDSSEDEVCQDVWFPDPPTEPENPGGSGGGDDGGNQDANDPNNDLPLPCENVDEPDFDDIINVRSPIAQQAIIGMLPYYYQQFIKFDANGNLNKEVLLSGTTPPPGILSSDLFDALVYIASKPDIDINMYLSSSWKGKTTQYPDGANYAWETQNQNLWGVTVVPGDVPLEGVPITGDKTLGAIYINNAKSSSKPRLSIIVAHELLGHMYKYLKKESFTHGDPKFEKWIRAVEDQANITWKLLKKWKSSKLLCPQ